MKGEGLGNTADRLKKLDKSKDEDQVLMIGQLLPNCALQRRIM